MRPSLSTVGFLIFAFSPSAYAQPISLECIAKSAIPPATGTHPQVVENGDFQISGNPSYTEIGDGYNERTRWTCDFSRQLDISKIDHYSVHSSTLQLHIVTGDSCWCGTDTVGFSDLIIIDSTIRSRLPNSETKVTVNYLDHYDSDAIIEVIKKSEGTLELRYSDDATVIFARLNIELRPVAHNLDLSGYWDSRYNWMDSGWVSDMGVCLRKDGIGYSGNHFWANGTKSGTVTTTSFEGSHLEYNYSGSDCTGSGYFDIASDGQSMTGQYQCAGDVGIWDLSRPVLDHSGICRDLDRQELY